MNDEKFQNFRARLDWNIAQPLPQETSGEDAVYKQAGKDGVRFERLIREEYPQADLTLKLEGQERRRYSDEHTDLAWTMFLYGRGYALGCLSEPPETPA